MKSLRRPFRNVSSFYLERYDDDNEKEKNEEEKNEEEEDAIKSRAACQVQRDAIMHRIDGTNKTIVDRPRGLHATCRTTRGPLFPRDPGTSQGPLIIDRSAIGDPHGGLTEPTSNAAREWKCRHYRREIVRDG